MSIQLVRVNEGLRQPLSTPWPETFTPHVIACLLTWTGDPAKIALTGDIAKYEAWKREVIFFRRWIEDACQRGELDYIAATESRMVSPETFVPPRLSMASGHFQPDGKGYMVPAKYLDFTTRHIAAAPLAHWLESQDHPPGELLKAWFKAQGVDRTAVDVVAPPAPAKKETVPERNARWLKVWDEESPMHAPSSQARAIAKIVAAEGVERATVKKALQTAEKAREEARRGGNVSSMPKNKKAPASPFPTTVHRMK